MTTKKSTDGKARVLGIEGLATDESIFETYRQTQDAIKQLNKELSGLKPMLKDIVEKHGGKFEHEGYLAQMIETKPSKVLKTKDEVLAFVPKKYHYNIVKDMIKAPYIKVALAPKDNIVEVELKELV